jgi:hypothetical protein
VSIEVKYAAAAEEAGRRAPDDFGEESH